MSRRLSHYRKISPSDMDSLPTVLDGIKGNTNLKLYVPFSGANNAVTTKDFSRSNHTLTFNGGAKISTAQSYYNGGSSLYCAGGLADDVVTIPHSSDFNLGTNTTDKWTIKFKMWANANRVSTDSNMITHFQWSEPYTGWGVYLGAGNQLTMVRYPNGAEGATAVQTPTAITLNKWLDCAIICDGLKVYLFVDGIPMDVRPSYGIANYTGNLTIGGTSFGNQYFYGYIQDVMIIKGEAWNTHKLYDTTLDAKSANLVAGWKFGDYGVYDCVGANHLTNSGSVAFTTTGIQGYKCGVFSGDSPSILKLPANSTDFNFGSGDWSMSFWLYRDALNHDDRIIGLSKTDNTTYSFECWVKGGTTVNDKIIFYFSTDGGSTWSNSANWTTDGSITIPATTWTHVIIQREGTYVRTYINGVFDFQWAISGTIYFPTSEQVWLGASHYGDGAFKLQGRMQEFLVHKGSYLSTTEISLLYNSGKAKLLQLESKQHKQLTTGTYDTTYNFHNATLDAKASYLKAGWKLDSTKDYIGSHDLTNTGVTFATEGLKGYKCGTFNGSSYLTAVDSADWNFGSGDFTWSGWLNPTTGNTYYPLFGQSIDGDNRYWLLYDTNTPRFAFYCVSGGVTLAEQYWNTTLTYGTLYHITLVRSGSDLNLYINNSLISITSTATPIGTMPDLNSVAHIGRAYVAGGWNYTKGLMQDLLIYKGTALTPTEISLLYNSGKARLLEMNPQEIVNSYSKYLTAGWKLDEMSGTRYDSAGFNHLTSINSASYSTDPVMGNVVQIDRANDRYLTATITSDLSPSNKLTFSTWANFTTLPADGASWYIVYPFKGSSPWDYYRIMVGNSSGTYTWSFCVRQSNGTEKTVSIVQTPVADTWYLVTLSADGTNVNGYINAVAGTPTSYDGTMITGAGTLYIGRADTSAYTFNGRMSNTLLWSGVALDATAISALYNDGLGRRLNTRRLIDSNVNGMIIPFESPRNNIPKDVNI